MNAPYLEAHEPVTLKEWFVCVDGVAIKQMHLEREGWFVKQHRHVYDHVTLLATGSMRVWMGDNAPVDYVAPYPITVKAGVTHSMQALADNTVAYCIHNVSRTGEIDVHLEE